MDSTRCRVHLRLTGLTKDCEFIGVARMRLTPMIDLIVAEIMCERVLYICSFSFYYN